MIPNINSIKNERICVMNVFDPASVSIFYSSFFGAGSINIQITNIQFFFFIFSDVEQEKKRSKLCSENINQQIVGEYTFLMKIILETKY